ncbi:S-adenosylmethionine decarboxylase [Mucilaginibacter sp. BJC16-A38]|uniref:S-adenosylmethionine decarboxylase n=1 Tax=Mucilaginibacter phenanthrenivorans TaxID=1234842 RepID=UPI00215835AE|nr:S-adenosylmethionine decarboxylase [Mucilaginibacter phenanthrenivorans]MCR8560418.1 S-adenosylmethionine decarboxylase [Mucilaginibacter phenanthrenivorans]
MEAVIFNRACWIFDLCADDIVKELELMLIQAEFSILNSTDHVFSPQGYTKIWLLAESHFAIHTFPEQNAFYLELSSCIESKAKFFWIKFQKWTEKYNVTYKLFPTHINRGLIK